MNEPAKPGESAVTVYLIDGTYELFRAFYGAPSSRTKDGREVGAARTLYRSLRGFLREPGVTHVAAAFDTVIESFRNELFAGYKTGQGIDPNLWAQFPLAEQVTRALGIVTWSMIDFECDDALATFAMRAAEDPRVSQVRITSPDKDFCQCVRENRVVLYDRKKREITDEAGVRARLGVTPAQVPALLALVGDTADGIPGIPRWGEKSAQAVLARYGTLDAIPDDPAHWDLTVRGKDALARELSRRREDARLYERLATLRYDVPLAEDLDALRVKEPAREALEALARELEFDPLS
jgi:5'-3' exonuclease